MTRFKEVAIERVSGYWDARPCNLRHSESPVGTRQYFDEVEARKYFVEPHIPGFAEFARWKGKRVLEIGCGIGTDTVNFARAGVVVTAVDLSERSLELARKRAEIFGLDSRVTFHRANAEELSSVVPPEPYDLVYSFGVIHHTPHPERVVAQVRRHFTRPGSVFKVMVYHRNSTKVARILAENRFDLRNIDAHVARHSEAQTGCPVTYTYTRSGVRRLLEGFRVEKTAVEHIFPYRVADYVQYRYVKGWPWNAVPEPLFRRLERILGWHLCVTATVPGP